MRTCEWCGCKYITDHYWPDNDRFCSGKCKSEYENAREGKRKLNEIKAIEQERLAIERRREKMELERIRKADPKQWYGSEWVEHLLEHPEDANKCQWSSLERNDIKKLLKAHPEFADKCQWAKLESEDIIAFLKLHPEFVDMCPWQRLKSEDTRVLIEKFPQFAEKCRWSNLESVDIRMLLESHPEFINRVNLKNLSAGSWSRLLMVRPEFGEKCTKWESIDAEHWIMLLKCRKEFAQNCSSDQWVEILLADSTFKAWYNFSEFNVKQVSRLLVKYPKWVNEFTKEILEKIDLSARVKVLCQYPDLVNKIKGWDDFSGFNSEQVVEILLEYPSWHDKFEGNILEKINAKNRVGLFIKHPKLVNVEQFSDWSIFSPNELLELLFSHKEFSKYCIWEAFNKEKWERVLEKYPEFKEKCDAVIDFLRKRLYSKRKVNAKEFWTENMWGEVDWFRVAEERPEIASACLYHYHEANGKIFHIHIGHDWLKRYPHLLCCDCIDWSDKKICKASDYALREIFLGGRKEHALQVVKAIRIVGRSFLKYYLAKQDERYWEWLIVKDPHYIKYCPHSSLNICKLIAQNPATISLCNISSLDKKDWTYILDRQPQLLSYCKIIDELSECSVWSYRIALDENLLSGVPKKINLDWEVILTYNPGIAKKCGKRILKSISSGDWSRILCKQPQLFPVAESCGAIRHRFDKYDWNHLIEEQPQFKNEYWKWRVARFFGSVFRKLFYTSCILATLGGVGYCVLNYASESTLAMIRGVFEKATTAWTDISAKVVSIDLDYQLIAKLVVGFLVIIFVWWWIRRAVKTFSKKRWKFLFIGLFLGFLGLHLAYAKRWKLFWLYWGLLILFHYIPGICVLFCLLTTFFVKKDGDGNRM